MLNFSSILSLFGAALLLVGIGNPSVSSAADKDNGGKAAGILLEKKDKWLLVKVDGDDEPTKFTIADTPEKKLTDSLKSAFDACRVELTYTKDGDSKQLATVKRQILKEKGTFMGIVVKVHNDFWVEVKPKTGPADAFAPGANFKDKEFMEKLKALQKGDSVTITYVTDGERHRITALKKN